jgi:release factor glutamine methyltransferase
MAHTTFLGMPLAAAPGSVMTPRPASERLVEAAVAHVGDRPARVVDVGTGSGAVALGIARAAPAVTVWATDTSRSAVGLARRNARLHGLDGRVLVRHGDLLAPVPGSIDVVVANLPYLPAAQAAHRSDLASEPDGAVFAPGDGLDHYRRLFVACEERLDAAGLVVVQFHREVMSASPEELADLLARMERHAAACSTAFAPAFAGVAA